ncbi:MAG: hypothetical protein IJC23_04255 [Bacteroidaceae bacterium]|nr:hypothetical protein [Bacteroidaceae bacterium]
MLTNIHNITEITADILGGSDYFVSKQSSKQAIKQASKQLLYNIICTREENPRACPYSGLPVCEE